MHILAIALASTLAPAPQQSSPASIPQPPAELGWVDVDVDGLPDLLARGSQGELQLLRNLGSDGFEDVTAAFGLSSLGAVRRASWQDVDGDGLSDLLVCQSDGSLRLWRHFGAFFQDVSNEAGLGQASAATSEHWLDADADGRPDLVVVAADHQVLYHNHGGLRFAPETLPAALVAGSDAAALPTLPTQRDARPTEPRTGRPSSAPAERRDEDRRSNSTRTELGATAGGATARPAAGRGTPGTQPGVSCTPSLMDQAGGACIEASSAPLLGALMPLNFDFNLTPSGDVGMGTTQPLTPMHIVNNDMNLQATALASETVVVEDRDAVVGMYSDASGNWGSAVVLGQVGPDGGLQDKWTMTRRTSDPFGNGGSGKLHVGFGSNADFSSNLQVLTLEPDGDVAIGTETASNDRLNVYSDEASGSVARIQNGNAQSSSDAMIVYHNGKGAAINASTNTGEHAIRASGAKGVYASGSDYGVHAYSGAGTALWAQNDSNSPGAAIIATSTADLPTLSVTNYDPTDPKAASFGGDVDVGYPGFAGLTVVRASIGTDSTNAGFVQLLDDTGTTRILLDANSGGEGRIVTDVLEIKGGADLVETFDTRESDVEPGTVMIIDPQSPGELAVSRQAFDSKVAGVVSGAGGVKPGLTMGQEGVASGDTPVALTGRVFVKVSCENGAIRPGDRLTTSALAGHAMRVADGDEADGAVLGKAMGALDAGTGLVLVLVNLQ